MSEKTRLWGGRFAGDMNSLTSEYTAGADRELFELDIAASRAHARMLGATGIISESDATAIVDGLGLVLDDFRSGSVAWSLELEDIHTHVEARLREHIGEVSGRLHTGRSRNDQVATLGKLLVRDSCDSAAAGCDALIGTLVDLADKHAADPLPGYTHLQRAQPVTLGHHLLAYGEMLLRDRDRFWDCRARANVLPLGSGALAGSPYPLDREMVARELEFDAVSRNSIDATADRDFVAEYLAAAAITQVHLSRLAEEIVIWASAEFDFVELPDEFATGSSIMPQKKNADVAELARGRSGSVIGNLVSALTTLKGLPLAYNRDLQEDKKTVQETNSVLLPSLGVFSAMLPQLGFKTEIMRRSAAASFSLATDVADYLVGKGMTFREAHGVVGRIVKLCEERGCELSELPLEDYRAESDLFEEDVLEITTDTALAARDIPGGTAPSRVREAAAALRDQLAD